MDSFVIPVAEEYIQQDLDSLIQAHQRWLADGSGEPLDLPAGVIVRRQRFESAYYLNGANLEKVIFLGCDFTNVMLREADLSGTMFVECILRSTQLQDALCAGTVFHSCDMLHCDLSGAILHGATIAAGYQLQPR
jgi:uncharacterized protein YjbI with pentapeptide repeats